MIDIEYFDIGQFRFKFCLQLLSWIGHWKDPSQEFIPYKIITVTNYKNFYTAQRKKLVNKAEILLLIEIITGTFQSCRIRTKSVLISNYPFPVSCFARLIPRTSQNLATNFLPSEALLQTSNMNQTTQHFHLLLIFFYFFKCELFAQLLCIVKPKSSSLPVTNTKSEISALLNNK